MIKAILFDLDGTLIQSLQFWPGFNQKYLAERYGMEFNPEDSKAFCDMDFNEISVFIKEKYNLPDSIDTVIQDRIRMTEDTYRYGLKPVKGAADFVKKINLLKCRLAVTTNNSTRLADAALRNLGVADRFTLVLGTENIPAGAKSKPDPDIYLCAAEMFHLNPEECFVFEDTIVGLTAAKAAGMPACAVIHTQNNDTYPNRKSEMIRELELLSDYQIYDSYDAASEIPVLKHLFRQ